MKANDLDPNAFDQVPVVVKPAQKPASLPMNEDCPGPTPGPPTQLSKGGSTDQEQGCVRDRSRATSDSSSDSDLELFSPRVTRSGMLLPAPLVQPTVAPGDPVPYRSLSCVDDFGVADDQTALLSDPDHGDVVVGYESDLVTTSSPVSDADDVDWEPGSESVSSGVSAVSYEMVNDDADGSLSAADGVVSVDSRISSVDSPAADGSGHVVSPDDSPESGGGSDDDDDGDSSSGGPDAPDADVGVWSGESSDENTVVLQFDDQMEEDEVLDDGVPVDGDDFPYPDVGDPDVGDHDFDDPGVGDPDVDSSSEDGDSLDLGDPDLIASSGDGSPNVGDAVPDSSDDVSPGLASSSGNGSPDLGDPDLVTSSGDRSPEVADAVGLSSGGGSADVGDAVPDSSEDGSPGLAVDPDEDSPGVEDVAAAGAPDATWSVTDDSDDEASDVDDVAAIPTRQRSRRLRRGRNYLTYDRMGDPRVSRYTLMAVKKADH